MRPWIAWFSLLLLTAGIGWFWFLSSGLSFRRADHAETKPAPEQKVDGKTEK